MGRNRIIDEFGVTLFSNFFHDATKWKQKTLKWVYASVNLYNMGWQKKKKKLLQFPQTSLTHWQVLWKDGRCHCFGISDIRGLQGSNDQWTMWGWWVERIRLLTFFNSEPHHFYTAVKTGQRALPSKTQRLQENRKRGLNESHVWCGDVWLSILEHTWSFCMTSTAWFFRWFLSAQ